MLGQWLMPILPTLHWGKKNVKFLDDAASRRLEHSLGRGLSKRVTTMDTVGICSDRDNPLLESHV